MELFLFSSVIVYEQMMGWRKKRRIGKEEEKERENRMLFCVLFAQIHTSLNFYIHQQNFLCVYV